LPKVIKSGEARKGQRREKGNASDVCAKRKGLNPRSNRGPPAI
jgi:hypothetical protein